MLPYADGGPTCVCNLEPLCRIHHRLKTYGGWSARFTKSDEPHQAGTVEWTTQLGLKHVTPPAIRPGSNGWNPAALSLAPLTEPDPDGPSPADLTTAEQRGLERRRRWNRELDRINRKLQPDRSAATGKGKKRPVHEEILLKDMPDFAPGETGTSTSTSCRSPYFSRPTVRTPSGQRPPSGSPAEPPF